MARSYGLLHGGVHALAPDLHRRGGARRVRSAKDVWVMDAVNQPLLSVRDLSVAFRQGENGKSWRSTAFHSTSRRARPLALVGESGSRQVRDRAVGDEALALSGGAAIPPARSTSRARSCCSLSERDIRHVRGNDITIIFQEPMTSLNPLHTIERQIARDPADLHQRHHRRARARRASSSCSTQVGIPESGEAGSASYPHQLLRRPAPARHDRDGARQRARPPDRRRADRRARRHRAGAVPHSPEGFADAPRHGDAVHHP